jgi:superfamily II DNA/RNA helicase
MAESVEAIQERIRSAVAPGFREKLLARGQARSMIWRDGLIPDDAPSFSPLLTYDLLSYGYSLLSHGLRLLERNGDRDLARTAFEHAAGAMEAVVARGAPNNDRDFHGIVAGAAYHLGRFSARAYSLLQSGIARGNLAPTERCLAALMLRDIDGLNEQIVSWRLSGIGSDDALATALSQLQLDIQGTDDNVARESSDFESEVLNSVDSAITDNFMGAMSIGVLAFDSGNGELIDHAMVKLRVGLGCTKDLNLVPQWWIHRLTMLLLQDLWDASFHRRLPLAPTGGESQTWSSLRELFIASLYRRSRAEIELWPSQLGAAERALDLSDNLVVSLPTSAGKTRIAELCILACIAAGKRVVFVTPLRSLSAQTESSLRRTFQPLGKTVSSLYGSIGISDVDANVLGEQDIIVTTPEKLDFALRSEPALLDDVGLVVLDEGHMIGMGEREIRYEVQIQRLLKRPDAAGRRIVCLSAIFPEGEQLIDFVGWLTNDKPDGLVKNDWRPTRLRFGEIVWQGDRARLNVNVGDEKPFIPRFLTATTPPIGARKRKFPADQRELCLASAWRLVEDGHTVLIFCPLRKSVEPFATAIVDLNRRGALPALLQDQSRVGRALAIGEEWFGPTHPVMECLKLGVAIHHGTLPTSFRKEIERLLNEAVVKVTISSPTLSQGLNLSATTLIFHGLYRGRNPIESSEFRNVVGRAGRAYVDLEGLVLYPMFDDLSKRRARWRALVDNDSGREMESGLLRLVATLLSRMQKKLGTKAIDSLLEYIANNAAWEFPELPSEQPVDGIDVRVQWRTHISQLDTAILSLLGEQSIADEEIEAALDIVLQSSLWERRLARRSEPTRRALKAGVVGRARFLWANSTPLKRRGYFLAGVGLATGMRLDAEAKRLELLLVEANGAILAKDASAAIGKIIEFAEIVFTIPPFDPEDLPDDWRPILAAWLNGKAVGSHVDATGTSVLQFVESTLVYRLPWAMEAVRVRALANENIFEDGATLSDFELRLAVASVETGSLSPSVHLLLRSGFGSRLAAIKVVEETAADFDSVTALRSWLKSPPIIQRSQNPEWPTPQTHQLWQIFLESFDPPPSKVWRKSTYCEKVIWFEGVPPAAGAPLRLGNVLEVIPLVLSADCQSIGILSRSLDTRPAGLLRARAGSEPETVVVDYLGPGDLYAT